MSPLARDNSDGASNSGRMPYLAGLKNVAWVESRNRITISAAIGPVVSAMNANAMRAVSTSLAAIRTLRLSNLSAT